METHIQISRKNIRFFKLRGVATGWKIPGIPVVSHLGFSQEVSKWLVSGLEPQCTLFIGRWNNPLILTMDPYFLGHPSTCPHVSAFPRCRVNISSLGGLDRSSFQCLWLGVCPRWWCFSKGSGAPKCPKHSGFRNWVVIFPDEWGSQCCWLCWLFWV